MLERKVDENATVKGNDLMSLLVEEMRKVAMAEDNTTYIVAGMIELAVKIQKGEIPDITGSDLRVFKLATETLANSRNRILIYPGMIRILEKSYTIVCQYQEGFRQLEAKE